MRKGTFVAALAALALSGCMGRGSSVATVSASDVGALRGSSLPEVYFVPFDTAGVKLKGDHGDASTAAANRKKWFTHVVAGAQRALASAPFHGSAVLVRDHKDSYDDLVMQKEKTTFRVSGKYPAGAVVVTGRYVSSENVGGSSRFWLGAMSGKSWNRADVTIRKGNTVVFKGSVDGKYLGSGYSWGYETLGVNEGLGAGIADVLTQLWKGERVEAKKK